MQGPAEAAGDPDMLVFRLVYMIYVYIYVYTYIHIYIRACACKYILYAV